MKTTGDARIPYIVLSAVGQMRLFTQPILSNKAKRDR